METQSTPDSPIIDAKPSDQLTLPENTELLKRLQSLEQKLVELQIESDHVFERIGQGIRIINRDYTVRRINQEFSQMSGVRPEDAIGKKCWEVFPSPFCRTPNCRLERILDGEELIQGEIERLKPNG